MIKFPLKLHKCIICGNFYEIEEIEEKLNGFAVHIDKMDCYVFYKRLLGIYGSKYLEILSGY